MTPEEEMKWQNYRKEKLMDGFDSPNLTMDEFRIEVENLAHEHENDPDKLTVLKSLFDYAQHM